MARDGMDFESVGSGREQACSRPADQPYQCPGEPLSISRSLHLARLASGYSACAKCPFRGETGTIPRDVVKRIQSQWMESLGTEDQRRDRKLAAIRGVYLNDLTRASVSECVAQILELQRAETASHSEVDQELDDSQASRDGTRQILIGHDWRPSSPDLAVGVVSTLRRWGCEIVDLGQVNRGCFDYAFSRFHADLGLFVTGGSDVETVNGLDIIDSSGMDWSEPGRLTQLRQREGQPVSRDVRQAGHYQMVSITANYEALAVQQFAGIDSLKVALACGEPLAMQILGRGLLANGCEVNFVDLNYSDPDFTRQKEQFRLQSRDSHVDIGLLIRPDGQSVFVFDERGHEVKSRALLEILSPDETALVFFGNQSARERDHSVHSLEELLTEFASQRWPVATDGEGRFWLRDTMPPGDAVCLVATLLRVLQTANWPLSVLRKTRQGHSTEQSGRAGE